MVEVSVFLKALSVTTLFVALMGGFGYWVGVMIKKSNPNIKYWIKYRVLRRKYNEQEVAMLLEDIEQGVSEGELYKAVILSNKASPEKAKELLYIFNELKKLQLKGGNVKHE